MFFSDLWLRLGTWYDAMHGFTVLGRGLGSFIVEFPRFQQYSSPLSLRWENAHNDIVQILFELGIGGFVLIALFAIRLAQAERRPEFYALVVFLVEGLFGFPLYQPVTGGLAAVCAGCIFGHGYSLRFELDRFGLRIRAGYAVSAARLLRARRRLVPDVSRAPGRRRLVRGLQP